MHELLVRSTEFVILLINAMALLTIAYGTLEAFAGAVRSVMQRSRPSMVWIHYGRWLIAGLTFQLAADILETSIEQDWEDIGRLAAIAAIRTALNFFLERDMLEVREISSENETKRGREGDEG